MPVRVWPRAPPTTLLSTSSTVFAHRAHRKTLAAACCETDRNAGARWHSDASTAGGCAVKQRLVVFPRFGTASAVNVVLNDKPATATSTASQRGVAVPLASTSLRLAPSMLAGAQPLKRHSGRLERHCRTGSDCRSRVWSLIAIESIIWVLNFPQKSPSLAVICAWVRLFLNQEEIYEFL